MVTSTCDPEPELKTPAEVRQRIADIRGSVGGRPDLVECGKADLFFHDMTAEGTPRVGDNVRECHSTDGPTYVVTDPANGREYHVDIRTLWSEVAGRE